MGWLSDVPSEIITLINDYIQTSSLSLVCQMFWITLKFHYVTFASNVTTEDIDTFAKCNIRALYITDTPIHTLAPLFGSTSLTTLSINFSFSKIADHTLEILNTIPSLTFLSLDLNHNELESTHVASFGAYANLKNLSLDLGCNMIGKEGVASMVEGLSKSTTLQSLHLNFYNNALRTTHCLALLHSINSLTDLDLDISCNQITDLEGIGHFQYFQSLKQLRVDLSDNALPDTQMHHLGELKECASLTSLDLVLTGNNIGDLGTLDLKELATIPTLATLSLSLAGNAIGDAGAKVLAQIYVASTNWPPFGVNVYLLDNPIGVDGAVALSSARQQKSRASQGKQKGRPNKRKRN
eukprot:TRINITY_DN67222_c1_g1_i1.p1 TRINITY_DN67222_c1_g1~~TRINITY_DN67222_c1_g1_i1.p1  ORF type:complete len:353 (-),score=-0.50 TRINITY_DN67222_c1_g1_i1:544-1602(-)